MSKGSGRPDWYAVVVQNDGDPRAPELTRAWEVIRLRLAHGAYTTEELMQATGRTRREVKGLLHNGRRFQKVWGRTVRRPVEVSPDTFVMERVPGWTAFRQH